MVQRCNVVNREGTLELAKGDVERYRGSFSPTYAGEWNGLDAANSINLGLNYSFWELMRGISPYSTSTNTKIFSVGYVSGSGDAPYVTFRMGLQSKTLRNDGRNGTQVRNFPDSLTKDSHPQTNPGAVAAPPVTADDWWNTTTGGRGWGVRRPHINATTLNIEITFLQTGSGTFGILPYVELIDNAQEGYEWRNKTTVALNPVRFDRAVYTSAALDPTTGAFTLTLDSELLRGWEETTPNGGIRDMGDLGIRVYAPGNPSDPSLRCILEEVILNVQETEPFYERGPDFGVRQVGESYYVVDYGDTSNFSTGEPLTNASNQGVGPDGVLTTYKRVVNHAVNWAGQLDNSEGRAIAEGTPVVIEIETNVAIVGGWASPKNQYWTRATGANRPIEDLIIRSVDRTGNGRVQVGTAAAGAGNGQIFIGPVGKNGAVLSYGLYAMAGIRVWRSAVYGIETDFAKWSDTMTLGMYDIHFTGFKATGGGAEMKSAVRSGYHAIDFCDCRVGTTSEHFIYDNATPDLPTQVLRNSAQGSLAFYPGHSNPDLAYPNGYLTRAFYQTAQRALPFWSSGGEGPPGNGNILVEDNWGFNLGTSGASSITIAGQMGNIIVRRMDSDVDPEVIAFFGNQMPAGALVICWGDSGQSESQKGLPKGMHTNLGQVDGPLDEFGYDQKYALANQYYQNSRGPQPITAACISENGKTGTCYGWTEAYIPDVGAYPHTGTAYTHGNVVVEDCKGTGKKDAPLALAGCKSIIIRRGDYSAFPNSISIWIDNNQGFTWWSTPWQSLSVRLEGMGDTPSTYTGIVQTGGKVRFGPTGSPWKGSAFMSNAQIDALKDANDWPPWPIPFRDIFTANTGSVEWPAGTFNISPWTNHRFKAGCFYPGMSGGVTKRSNGQATLAINWPPLQKFHGVQARPKITAPVVNSGTSTANPIAASLLQSLTTTSGADLSHLLDASLTATMTSETAITGAMMTMVGSITSSISSLSTLSKVQLGTSSSGFLAPLDATLVSDSQLSGPVVQFVISAPGSSLLNTAGSGDSSVTRAESGGSVVTNG